MSKDVSLRSVANTVRMRDGNFPIYEKVLVKYMQECTRDMNHQTLFRAYIVHTKALEVREKLLIKMEINQSQHRRDNPFHISRLFWTGMPSF